MLQKNRKQKLLFIHPGGLGDVILLAPCLQLLRQKLGEAWQIDLLVENRAFTGAKELFALTHWVDNLKVFDFKGPLALLKTPQLLSKIVGYSTVISTGSSPMVGLLLFLSGAKKRIGFKSKTSFLLTDSIQLNKNLYAPQMLASLIKPIVQDFQSTKLIPSLPASTLKQPVVKLENTKYFLVHPGVSKLGVKKRIIKSPEAAYWVELVGLLCDQNTEHKVVLIGGPDDREVIAQISQGVAGRSPNFINLSEQKFNIPELAALIKNSQAFICVDSAPLHLAVAVGANTVALFGPTDPHKLIPEVKNIKVVKVPGLVCQPCLWNRRSKACALPLCIGLQEPSWVIKELKFLV
jgi:ADP-heptose:LPS heptosyltransferase